MADLNDGQLLDAFVKTSDSAAFEQVVRRHLDWVYSCARRMVRDAHLAEDVTQAVFILLASKARGLRGREQLGGWLFRATRYCAANALKQQARRKHHEMEARIMQTKTTHDDDANWKEIYPMLDETVKGLGRGDRDAVLLRFYQGKTHAEVAVAMGISEEAAKKRVQRAVEKLREMMVKKGVTVSASGLANVMAVQVTQAAPSTLVPAVMAASKGAAGATMAGTIAQAAGKLMWLTQAKIAALLLVGSVAGGVTCGVAVYALAGQLNPRHSAASTSAADSTLPTTASNVFDVLYEKAPGSPANLSMTVGPNTFAVTAVVRYGADGRPVATDGQGKSINPATLHLANAQPPTGANKDVVIVFLDPPPERYDIDRLRVFDHLRRTHLDNVRVTRVPGVSALRLVASGGGLPPQIDLWLHVASYDATNMPVSLAPKKDATAAIGTAQVGFVDIRDGRWNITAGQFTSRADDSPLTTLELKATGVWDVGRYQIAAISKAKEKYISDFFIDLSNESMPFLDFPFSLDQIDHFELRPNARQTPFFFDGIILPATASAPPKANPIPQPVIVDAGTRSRVSLPSGAMVELRGIARPAPLVKDWWGLDGRPVSLVAKESTGWVSDDDGRLAARVFSGRLFKALNGQSELLWQFDPAAGWAGGGNDTDSRITAALDAHSPVTVRLGAPATPWTTLEEFTPDKLPAESQCWTGAIDALKSTDHGVTLTTSIGNLPSNVRLVLIDDKGHPHWPDESSSSVYHEKFEPWGLSMVCTKYRGFTRDKVHSVRLETRREEFAAFKNVPLEPK